MATTVRRDTKSATGYRWIEKDPILDLVNALVEASEMSVAEICAKSGVAPTTLRAWRFGKTKRPQAVTVKFVLDAMGYALAVERHRDRAVALVPMNPRTGKPAVPQWRTR